MMRVTAKFGFPRDIHPNAIISKIYFENMFCLMPYSDASTSTSVPSERSKTGLKVVLGDSSSCFSFYSCDLRF